ncbi:PREDICTED: uncharacterized protein LOC105560944, partial [Vollenhovia emeryi]|uniref:uncharacterized protein LOC105560944 n=1 Tax=Vollenhovia emeryi TaxID=411798 RepID=UPI0005F470D4
MDISFDNNTEEIVSEIDDTCIQVSTQTRNDKTKNLMDISFDNNTEEIVPEIDDTCIQASTQTRNVSIQTSPKRMACSPTKQNLRKIIKYLGIKIKRKENVIKNHHQLMTALREKGNYSKELENALIKQFTGTKLSLILNEFQNSTRKRNVYTDSMKQFALTLYFYSPKAYDF